MLASQLHNAEGFEHVFINPRPEGYGSRFVVLSIYLSVCQPRYREQRSLLRAS